MNFLFYILRKIDLLFNNIAKGNAIKINNIIINILIKDVIRHLFYI